jgi:hypothetical protein
LTKITKKGNYQKRKSPKKRITKKGNDQKGNYQKRKLSRKKLLKKEITKKGNC